MAVESGPAVETAVADMGPIVPVTTARTGFATLISGKIAGVPESDVVHPDRARFDPARVTTATSALGVARDSLRGKLPPRYREPLDAAFNTRARELLRPDMDILDVGSGRRPSVEVGERPAGSRYVGLDISADELRTAPTGSYDEEHVSDITAHVPALDARFDLILSYQVLEHVKPLAAAFTNMHNYLRPGGTMLVQMSGSFSPHGIVNRVLPEKIGRAGVTRLTSRKSELVFTAYYDDCWASRMERLLAGWTSVEIDPIFRGGKYLNFSRPLRAAYLLVEEHLAKRRVRNLGSYFLVEAVK